MNDLQLRASIVVHDLGHALTSNAAANCLRDVRACGVAFGVCQPSTPRWVKQHVVGAKWAIAPKHVLGNCVPTPPISAAVAQHRQVLKFQRVLQATG